MPTFQEIYNKYNSAQEKGLIKQDESLSTFAQRGFQVTGDPSYKNIADSGWFSNSLRSRSADLSNFIESGPVDEFTSEAIGRIGDLFGITPSSSRAVGKKLPRMAVDFLPMMVGAAFAAPTGGASLLPALGMAGTSVLSAASAFEDTGRPLDAIIGGAVPYLGSKLAQVGSTAALKYAEKSKLLNRLGVQGGTQELGAALNAAESAQLAAQGFSPAAIGATTVNRTVVKSLADKAFGYGAGQVAANAGFFGLDTIRYGPETTFTKDYAFNSLIGNLAFGLADIPRAFRPTTIASRFNMPKAQEVYLTPGEERSVRAAAMFKDMEDPAQIEALKRRYGLDITNIELNAEKLRAAQMERTTGQELVTKDFVSRWNNYLESDPLFNQETNGAFRITQGGAFGKEIVGLDKVLEAKNLPARAQELVDGFKDQRAVVRKKYSNVVSSMVKPASMEESLTRSVQELGLDEFLAKPVAERDYHTALKDSLLSPEGIDLVRDIHRVEAKLKPLNEPLWKEFEDFYLGNRSDLDFDKRVDLAVAVSLARGNRAKVEEARAKAKEAKQEGQKDPVVVEEFVGKLEEDARDFVQSNPKIQQDAKLAQAVKVEEDLKVEEAKVEQAKAEVRRLDITPEELATARVNLDNQLRAFVAKAEEAKRLREEAARVVQETVVQPQADHPAMVELKKFVSTLPEKGQQAWAARMEDAQNYFTTGDEKFLPPVGDLKRKRMQAILEEVDPQVKQRALEISQRLDAEMKRNQVLREKVSKKEGLTEEELEELQPPDTVGLDELTFDGLPTVDNEFSWAKDKTGKSYLIPVPEGDFETVRPFAEKLMAKLVPAGEVKERSAELIELAKFFNNPEVVYARLKGVVEGQGDAQFARASAGAFDFGMREVVDGKLIRPGKPPLGTKDGWMTELEFRVNGGDLGPLQKDEVAFYKQLVPEAFAGDKVHLQKLWDGLNKVGEQVKVVTYGQGGIVTPQKARHDELSHWLDTNRSSFGPDFKRWEDNEAWMPRNEVDVANLSEEAQQHGLTKEAGDKFAELLLLRNQSHDIGTGPRATPHYNQISPFDTKKFPVVRVDVVLSNKLGENQEFVKQEQEAIQELQRRNYSPVRDQEGRIVKLKDNTAGQEVELNNLSVALNSVVESANEASILKSRNKDKEITLWQQDNLHENLPNTLGWAMVQIVPHPVTGEKVMFVGEAQSRWGQEVQRIKAAQKQGRENGSAATDVVNNAHPLLPIHQNLILKSVIKEAQKQGISKVAVSDGETAMITEEHDTAVNLIPVAPKGEYNLPEWRNQIELAPGEVSNGKFKITSEGVLAQSESGRWLIDIDDINATRLREITTSLNARFGVVPRPSQEGGMRLAYDTTMPSIMSKLVGEGKVEDFGLHKNAIQGNARENPMETRTFPTIDEAENFLSQQPGELNHGSIRRVDNGFEVNTPKIGSPVFRNPDGTPKSSVTGIVYNISNPSPRVSTLFAQNQGKVYGAASYDKMQILINSKAFQNKSPAEQLKFIWAHENSHISFRKSLEGQYGPKAKALADALLAWVNSADPQARKNVEDVVRELHLDPELAQLDGIRDVLNNPDPQEWLANVWAMYALGTLKPNNSKAAFSMLPRPIRDFFDWAVSGIQNLAKGAQMWARLSGKDYKAAKDMKELMNTVRRSFRQAEWDAAQAEKFLDIEPSSMIERGNEFAFAQSQENDLDRMGQVGEQKVTDWRTFKRQMGNLWNKAIQPAHTLANSHKEFVEPVLAMYNAPLDTDNAIGDVFKVVVGELDGRDKVQITNKAFERVQKSESLLKLANAIMIRAEVKNQRMIKLKDDGDMVEVVNFDALSPEQRGQFQQFSPEAQQALATYIAQAERANIMTQKKNLESTWSEITSNLALLLTSKSSFNKDDFKKAPAIAEGMLKDLQLGDTEGAVSKLVGLDEFDRAKLMEQTQQLYAEYAKLEKFYNERPTYMSFKRFGDIRQRISKPGEQDDVVDADTELELQEKLKPYLADGWTQTNARIPKKERKNQEYRVNSDLLKLMNDREKLFKNMIQESGTISDEDKNMILNYPSSSDAMISEINSRELYKPTTGRKRTGDLARYDWYEQFVKYTPAAISSAQRRALSAKINFWMQDPALLNKKLQKDQFMALYEQSRNPDPEWVRKVNKLNAVWHIGWNLPGHIAELFQPMVAMLPELQAKGESLPGALKLIQKAERDVVKMHGYRFKDKLFRPDKAEVTVGGETFEGLAAMWIKANGTSKETVDEARMLHEKRGRIQKAPLSEIRDFTGENQIRLEDSMVGRTMSKLKDAVTRPFHTYASAAMGFYSNFTQHNGVVSLITSYRKFRKQGLSHEEAMQKAELFDLTVNNSGGRLERSELYGKLGSIGPLVLGLSSYTRGRFSQLATFYRHGFNSKQFEGKLSNAEIANAKKAFQTMILAQVGAAGLLGLPFVGAGIALMEELLGEDIKGKMLTALDEVTNDPTLSRVFSHGMMSAMAESFGVPADLHSRFALSSFLGTNSYDGISAKSFMGPSVAMLDSMFNLGSELAKGESMEKALTVAGPGGVKRLAEAISEDFQRDNPEANLASSMLGFRSSQMVKRKEWDQITRKQELEGRRDLEKSAMEISKKMEINPRLARQQLLIEADKLVPQGLDRQGIVNQRQQNIKDLIQKVSLLQADKVGPQDPRRQVSGRVAPIASQTAQAMGVQMQNPMELARAMAQQKTRSQLGATSSQRPVRNAMLQEMQWSRNPWEF